MNYCKTKQKECRAILNNEWQKDSMQCKMCIGLNEEKAYNTQILTKEHQKILEELFDKFYKEDTKTELDSAMENYLLQQDYTIRTDSKCVEIIKNAFDNGAKWLANHFIEYYNKERLSDKTYEQLILSKCKTVDYFEKLIKNIFD